jgi:adenylate kinase family enzyme
MNAAIEANDYSLLTAEMQEKISEEKFDKISTKHALHDAVKTAIEAQDYSLVPEEAQERITQEKFEEIITNQAQKSAVRDAIEANDYQAFVEVADEKALERISSEADFDAAVAKNQERAANKEALETTIQNNDFASFQKLVEQHQANKEAARPDDAPERDEPTTEQQQEKFDSLVEYYNTNGELPAMNKGKHQGR